MNNIILYAFIIGGAALFLTAIISIINQRFKSRFLDLLLYVFGYLSLSFIGIMLLYMFISALFMGLYIIYIILFWILSKFISKEVTTFLSLFGVLSIGVYFPDKVGYLLLRLLDLVAERNFHTLYPSFVKLLRIKLWVYLFAFLISIISSIETVGGCNIINIPVWLSIKPYIIQAVVTFIAFDRFINLIRAQLTDIKKDFKNIKIIINKIFNKGS
jgi:hypothetical protein